jgi:hypothetical protein
MTTPRNVVALDFGAVALPELEVLLDLVMQLGMLDERLSRFEQMVIDAQGVDPLAELVARIEAVETGLASLQRRGFKIPVELHVNEVTARVTRKTEVTPSHVVANLHDRMSDLALRCLRLEHETRSSTPTPTERVKLADLSARLSDESMTRKQDDDRLRGAIATLDKRVTLGARLFARFNRHLVARETRERPNEGDRA